MTPQYVTHINLTTGIRSRSFISEVDADTLARVQALLLQAIEPDTPPIELPGADAVLTVAVGGQCVRVTVADTHHAPIAMIGITRRDGRPCVGHLWRALHAFEGVLTSADHVPRAPWVAVVPRAPLPHCFAAFEAQIGWAWITLP